MLLRLSTRRLPSFKVDNVSGNSMELQPTKKQEKKNHPLEEKFCLSLTPMSIRGISEFWLIITCPLTEDINSMLFLQSSKR